jgi:hypothetical protein
MQRRRSLVARDRGFALKRGDVSDWLAARGRIRRRRLWRLCGLRDGRRSRKGDKAPRDAGGVSDLTKHDDCEGPAETSGWRDQIEASSPERALNKSRRSQKNACYDPSLGIVAGKVKRENTNRLLDHAQHYRADKG